MASLLEDLDELVLRCRDKKTRLYMVEAVAGYRTGAFRASIVSCWIAVCFDIIEKLRELALSGDKEAETHVQKLDEIRENGDIAQALRFEKDLLKLARDKFELISDLEFSDLERLYEDRNRCAHPSLTVEGEAYSPIAELARLHIHSAVTHLLQHPPAQGKSALEKLLRDVESDYFPLKDSEAYSYLKSGPLSRPRRSLLRSFIVVLVKGLLSDDDYHRKHRKISALKAAVELHREDCFSIFKDDFPSLFQRVDDESLDYILFFLDKLNDAWQFIGDSSRLRIKNYVCAIPSGSYSYLEFCLQYKPLREDALQRVKKTTEKDLSNVMFIFSISREMMGALIDIYIKSYGFDRANAFARTLIDCANDMTREEIEKILTSIQGNEQVMGSFEIGNLIRKLKSTGIINEIDFNEILISNGLKKYV